MRPDELARALRLLVITDRHIAHPSSVLDVVRACLAAGTPAVQLRNKGDSARELLALGHELRALTREKGALFFVNDRLDVAIATEADGIHLGPDDLPVAAVRRVSPEEFIIGRSADDPEVARAAVADGADYIGCGTVYATSTKPDAGEVIGLEGLRRVVEAVPVPVVGIGGITVERASDVAMAGAAGIAAIGAVMAASQPGHAAGALMTAFAER
jgi:thiamine-phosphate diphosphorylase